MLVGRSLSLGGTLIMMKQVWSLVAKFLIHLLTNGACYLDLANLAVVLASWVWMIWCIFLVVRIQRSRWILLRVLISEATNGMKKLRNLCQCQGMVPGPKHLCWKCQRSLLNAQLIDGLHPEHYLRHTVSVFTFFQKKILLFGRWGDSQFTLGAEVSLLHGF